MLIDYNKNRLIFPEKVRIFYTKYFKLKKKAIRKQTQSFKRKVISLKLYQLISKGR